MKLAAGMLLTLLATLASARSVDKLAKPPTNLLQASGRQPFSSEPQGVLDQLGPFGSTSDLAGAGAGNGAAHSADFFTKDFEKMDELPNSPPMSQKKQQCHPKCRWSCGKSDYCNSLCSPRCQPPKCVTACKKIALKACKRVCKDPQCAVVCPPQCEHGRCPKCKTVCGASVCSLNCGQSMCENSCADPDCVWDCKLNPACEKPQCKMTCDNSVCSFGKDQKLPDDHEVPYMGQEVAWKGLGKIPVANLAAFAPKQFSKPGLMNQGAKPMKGAKKVPKGGIKSITGDTGVVSEATVNGPVRWVSNMPSAPKILAPSSHLR